MPRRARCTSPSLVYHVYNRGNQKQVLFLEDSDLDEFVVLLRQASEREPMRILAYCLMRNHWHLVLWPHTRHGISRYIHWLATVHSLRFRARTHTTGLGHLYQDRFKVRPVYTHEDYVNLVRYVEVNPLKAGLVARAEDWRWSSLDARRRCDTSLVQAGPVALPLDWVECVNQISLSEVGTVPAVPGRPE